MPLGMQLLLLFVIGLPISFGIGCFIGWLVDTFAKRKPKSVWMGGILYIVAQPVSFFLVVLLEMVRIEDRLGFKRPWEGLSGFEMIFSVCFAVIFTTIIYMVIKKKSRRKMPDL